MSPHMRAIPQGGWGRTPTAAAGTGLGGVKLQRLPVPWRVPGAQSPGLVRRRRTRRTRLEACEGGARQRLRPARPVRGVAGSAHAEAQEGVRRQHVERDVARAAGEVGLLAEAGDRGQGSPGLLVSAVTLPLGALALALPGMEQALPALPQLAEGGPRTGGS